MKQGDVVPSIGVAGWMWSPEYGGMFAVCDDANLWLACDGPDAGLIGFYTERDWDDLRFRSSADALRASRRLQQAVAIWGAIEAGQLRVPARTTRPRTATGVPPVSWHEAMRLMNDGFVKHAQDQLNSESALYRFANDVLARHEREIDELGN